MDNQNQCCRSTSGKWILYELLFISIIAVAACVWFSNPHLSGRGISWCIRMAVVGTIGLVANTLIPLRRRKTINSAAQRIVDQQKALYAGPHTYAPALLDQFPDADRSFYDSILTWATSKGFAHLGDIEDVTTSTACGRRTLTRAFRIDDGSITASVWHLHAQTNAGVKDFKTVNFRTEFSDQQFLLTSTAQAGGKLPQTPGITTRRYSPDTLPDQLLELHRAAMQEEMAKDPSLSIVPIQTIEQLIQSYQRSEKLASDHRKSIGYMSGADLERFVGRSLTNNEQALAKRMEKLSA
jgi:hypothetical protein